MSQFEYYLRGQEPGASPSALLTPRDPKTRVVRRKKSFAPARRREVSGDHAAELELPFSPKEDESKKASGKNKTDSKQQGEKPQKGGAKEAPSSGQQQNEKQKASAKRTQKRIIEDDDEGEEETETGGKKTDTRHQGNHVGKGSAADDKLKGKEKPATEKRRGRQPEKETESKKTAQETTGGKDNRKQVAPPSTPSPSPPPNRKRKGTGNDESSESPKRSTAEERGTKKTRQQTASGGAVNGQKQTQKPKPQVQTSPESSKGRQTGAKAGGKEPEDASTLPSPDVSCIESSTPKRVAKRRNRKKKQGAESPAPVTEPTQAKEQVKDKGKTTTTRTTAAKPPPQSPPPKPKARKQDKEEPSTPAEPPSPNDSPPHAKRQRRDRAREEFVNKVRKIVEEVLASEQPEEKGNRKGQRDVQTDQLREVSDKFLEKLSESSSLPKKPSVEWVQREEKTRLEKETRLRMAEVNKQKRRIAYLNAEIERQTKENEEWQRVQQDYKTKRTQAEAALRKTKEDNAAHAEAAASGALPSYLREEDKQLLTLLQTRRQNLLSPTQLLTLQIDQMLGALNDMQRFDGEVEKWLAGVTLKYHEHFQSGLGNVQNPQALIKSIAKGPG